MPVQPTITEGYRTRVRRGQAERYRRIHARIPDRIARALIECGLVSWRIWIDGDVLFHAIETTDGRAELVRRMSARGPIDPAWDDLIASLVDDDPESSAPLDPVWSLTRAGQFRD
jgi:L-rhamnose mutarotase